MTRACSTALSLLGALALAAGSAQAQCTLPYTLSNGQPPDATKVMANFNALVGCFSTGGSTNSVQYNGGSGALAGAGPLTNGQTLIGSSGNPPQPATLTAGTGITMATGPGSVTLSAPSQASTGLYRQITSALPTAASTGLVNWLNQGTATVTETPVGISLRSVPTNALVGRFVGAPAAPYTLRALVASTTNASGTYGVGLGFYDGFSKVEWVQYGPYLQVVRWSSPTAFAGFDAAYNLFFFTQPIWLQLQDDGTNVSFAFSQDGVNFVTLYSTTKSAGYLGSTGYRNLVFLANPGVGASTIATLLSWSVN